MRLRLGFRLEWLLDGRKQNGAKNACFALFGQDRLWINTGTTRFVQGCGAKGYNPPTGAHKGPAGAYCCGDTNPPCPTCFYANAALPVVKNGVECFKSLGVPASKLVLAYPWYGYDYTCRADDSDICHVTSAKQVRKRILCTILNLK